MEVAGLTFGVIPLVVMIFQGYRLVRNFETEYNLLNHKLRRVLRDITVAGWLFKNAFDKILAETIDEDSRKLMLENPGSEYWAQYDLDLNGEIKRILGDLFEPMVESICGAQETLQEIRMLLLLLSGNKVLSKEKLGSKKPFRGLTMGVAAIATAVLQTDPLRLHFKNIQIQSTAKKLASLAKDHRGELEILRNQLRMHNQDLLDILHLCSHQRLGLRANTSPKLRRTSSTPQAIGKEPHAVARVSLDPGVIQTASQNLHRMVSNALACECHMAHLCLERQAKETVLAEDPKGKSVQYPPLEPITKFSFQLASRCTDSKRVSFAKHQVMHLVFTSCQRKLNDRVENNELNLTICKLAQNEGYERYLHDTGGLCDSGFLVQRAITPARSAQFSNFTSLEDLVVSRSAELQLFDRFLIATNLAYSLLHFYSSPWVRDWSLQTIHFFEKQERSSTTPGQWALHLPLKLDNLDVRQFGVPNLEIHSLGLILLQLGQRKRLEFSPVEKRELTLEKALANLSREMGPKYTKFVKNCLASWSDRNTDLRKDNNVTVFLSHVAVLEEGAQYFCPEN